MQKDEKQYRITSYLRSRPTITTKLLTFTSCVYRMNNDDDGDYLRTLMSSHFCFEFLCCAGKFALPPVIMDKRRHGCAEKDRDGPESGAEDKVEDREPTQLHPRPYAAECKRCRSD